MYHTSNMYKNFKIYRVDSGRAIVVGKAEEVATNCRKVEREAQRKDGGTLKITHELRETSIGGFVYGKGKMVFKKQIEIRRSYSSWKSISSTNNCSTKYNGRSSERVRNFTRTCQRIVRQVGERK